MNEDYWSKFLDELSLIFEILEKSKYETPELSEFKFEEHTEGAKYFVFESNHGDGFYEYMS